MPTRKVCAIFGDGDAGSGGPRLIDWTTGALLRDIPHGHFFTDDVRAAAEYGNYVYAVDSDSSIVCLDKDNAYVSRRDLGYYDGSAEFVHANADGVYVLKLNREFSTFDPATNALYKLLKLDPTTLATVTTYVLSSTNCGDALTNTNYLTQVDRAIAVADGIWVRSTSPTFASVGWVKLSFTGVELDTWDTTFQGYDVHLLSDGSRVVFSGLYDGGFSWSELDFSTKTLGTATPSFTFGTAFTTVARNGAGYLNGSDSNFTMRRVSSTSLQVAFNYAGGDDAARPELDSQGKAGGIALFTIDTGGVVVCDAVIPILFYDNAKLDIAAPKYCGSAKAINVNATDWLAWHDYGVWRISTTGVVWTFQWPYGTQQAYSSDGERASIAKVFDFTEYALTGSVTDTDPVAGREVLLYDQNTGHYLTKVAVSGTTYTATLFSTRAKFAVCRSANGSKNYEVNAHQVPA